MEAISLFKEVSSNPRKPQPKDIFTLSVHLSLGMIEHIFVSHKMKATNYPARIQGTEAKEWPVVYTTYQMGCRGQQVACCLHYLLSPTGNG